LYQLQITHSDYHYSTNETQFFSQQTLFPVSFSHKEWVKSFSKHFTKQETPRQLLWRSEHDSAAPVNRFRVVSKYVKGGLPKDRLVQSNIGIEEDRYSQRLYVEEDPRVF
jgi:hypothetical protein